MACIPVIHAQSSAQLLDSIVAYTISTDQDSIPKNKWVYQYNSKGVQTTYHLYALPSILSKWWLLESKHDTFDENGNRIAQIEHATLERGLGFPYVKHEWEYDSNGNKLHMFKYYKDEEQQEWQRNIKYDFKNDNNGQLIQRMEFVWGEDFSAWEPKWLNTYSYNSLGLETEQLVDSWSTEPQGWRKTSKIENTYSPDGIKLSEYHYGWNLNEGNWRKNVNLWKEYDSLGRMTAQENYNLGASFLSEYYYDSIGNCTSYFSSSLPWLRNYHPTVKNISTCNAKQEIIKEEKYRSIDGKWVPQDKTEKTYDDNGNVLMTTSYAWNQESNTWILDGRTHYYYQNHSSGINQYFEDEIIIYPNPTSGNIQISGLGKPSSVQVLNTKGQSIRIFQKVYESIDISMLPEGSYFLLISDGKKRFIKRLIKR